MIEKRLHLVRGAAAKIFPFRAGEGDRGRGQGEKLAAARLAAEPPTEPPTDTPTPDTPPTDTPTPPEPQRVVERMKTECERNAKG